LNPAKKLLLPRGLTALGIEKLKIFFFSLISQNKEQTPKSYKRYFKI